MVKHQYTHHKDASHPSKEHLTSRLLNPHQERLSLLPPPPTTHSHPNLPHRGTAKTPNVYAEHVSRSLYRCHTHHMTHIRVTSHTHITDKSNLPKPRFCASVGGYQKYKNPTQQTPPTICLLPNQPMLTKPTSHAYNARPKCLLQPTWLMPKMVKKKK